jgi:hypothetical protein
MLERIRKILEDLSQGKTSVDEVILRLKFLPFEDLHFAKIDTHRELRKDFPEVILCEGKTTEQVIRIVERYSTDGPIVATRATKDLYLSIKKVRGEAKYFEEARIVLIGKMRKKTGKGTILVVSGGTGDIPVAEEAAVISEIMGNEVQRLYDVGVAGAHRLFAYRDRLFEASVIIVVAGMEGALPSIVGGMVSAPVIAVPTSVGYGANFKGLSALLTMLNTCAPGVVVVNIDNGFGAGYFASIINQR